MAYGSCKKTSITQDPLGFETWDLMQTRSPTQKQLFTLGGQFAAAGWGQYDRLLKLA
jgi:hypothetical protein